MRYSVSFHREAENEMSEAAEFLDHQSPGLGRAFISAVERAVEQIRLHPEAVQLMGGRVRHKLVVRFPYSVIYSVRDMQIRILAVAHHRRRPHYWISRS